MTILLIALCLLLSSLALIGLGMRGRQTDDHPVCRKCRFDLTGLPAASTRCSECGAELSLPRAVIIGNRVRRTKLIGIGAIAVLLLTAGGAIVFSGLEVNPRFVAMKPMWWLGADVRFASPETQAVALAEISRRISEKLVTAESVAPLMDELLRRQQDLKGAWSSLWGTFIEDAHAAGAVDSRRWQRYLDQMMTISAVLRPQVCRGDPVPVQLTLLCRAGKQQRWGVYMSANIANQAPLPGKELGAIGTRFNDGPCSFKFAAQVDNIVVAAAPDGQTTLPVFAEARLYDGWYGQGPVVAQSKFHGQLPVTIHAANDPVVRAFKDDSIREAMAKSIHFEFHLATSPPWPKDELGTSINPKDLPEPIAYEMTIRAAGKEYSIASFVGHPGPTGGLATSRHIDNLSAVKTVDVILRPSHSEAAGDFDMTRYWDQEIVYHNVPVLGGLHSVSSDSDKTYPAEFPEK